MATKRSDAIVARTIQRAAEQMESEYRAARAGDAERLYDAFAGVIEEQRPNVEVLLFVLEIIRHGLIQQKTRDLFAQVGQTVEPAPERNNGHSHPHTVAFRSPEVADGLETAPLR
jgi:hypothetical protein